MAERSFRRFVEQELGWLPFFFIYAVLEWTLIIILFLDGTLSFLANEFARLFDLKTPCLLCTRIDHLLVQRAPTFYYNDSICDTHKKDLSALAYCHAHKKLSNVRKMCDTCLLSFATGKEADCGTYKSIVGLLHKDVELFANDNKELQLSTNVKEDGSCMCSCCDEPLKPKANPRTKHVQSQAPAPSPRAPTKNDGIRCFELPHIKYTGIQDDDDASKTPYSLREEVKTVTVPLLESEEITEDRTPTLGRGNKFFGIPLNDSANNTPRWMPRRKSLLDKTENKAESTLEPTDVDGDSIVQHLKRQVKLDRKSLIALYMELDEERSASAVAANNAMAMITRLQAEKAAVQMEALQYQRMMEEQAEYDQEALQETNMLLAKRDEEIKELTAELQLYRTRYGVIEEETSSVGSKDDLWETKSSFSVVERSECATPTTYKSVDDDQSTSSVGRKFLTNFSGGERVFNHQLTRIHEMVKSLRSYNEVLEQGESLGKRKDLLAQISGNLHQLLDASMEEGI